MYSERHNALATLTEPQRVAIGGVPSGDADHARVDSAEIGGSAIAASRSDDGEGVVSGNSGTSADMYGDPFSSAPTPVGLRFDRLWVVIPAFNEAEVIENVVAGVRRQYPNVVVVDDCSRDDTSARARKSGGTVLRHVVNLGQGAALQTGIDYALSQGAEYVVTFDADGQHRVEDIDVLCAAQREYGADAVIGSRVLGHAENIPAMRRLVLKLAVVFMRFSSGLKLTDAHNGLRLLNRHAASAIKITQNRMSHASEIINQLGASSLTIVEAPVTVIYTPYSLRKGQKLTNSIHILFEMLLSKVTR